VATQIVLDPDRFILTPVAGHFPEATWHWVDPRQVRPAAGTIDRLQGLKVKGVAEFVRRSAVIQISKAVDDLPENYSLPLPFSHPEDLVFVEVIAYGQAAIDIGNLTLGWTPPRHDLAMQQLLTMGELAPQRLAVGARAEGLSPMAQRHLRTRSALARVMPLSAGLTLEAPAQASPMLYQQQTSTAKQLQQPRLKAVMRRRIAPTSATPTSLHTTVFTVDMAKNAPRMAPPKAAALTGARLHRMAAPKAPAPTRSTHGARTLLNPAMGPAGLRHAKAFDESSQIGRAHV
jgi:hypothetical protein